MNKSVQLKVISKRRWKIIKTTKTERKCPVTRGTTVDNNGNKLELIKQVPGSKTSLRSLLPRE